MDKTEYHLKLDELTQCVQKQEYDNALQIAESIDWRRVKSIRTLNMVADIYEVNKDYRTCKDILLLAYNRASIGKNILYRLVEISLKLGEVDEAVDFYTEYTEAAPNDNSRYVLKYKIYKTRRAPLADQISILEEYKDKEYTERWAYELALLYNKSGNTQQCIDACDDLILWFGDGKYVMKAMELKMKYQPLSLSQQKLYEQAKYRASRPTSPAPVKPAKITDTDSRDMLERMEQAGAAITRNVSVPDVMAEAAATDTSVDSYSVTSKEFIGKTADLREQLAKSIHDVFSGIKKDEPLKTASDSSAEMPLQDAEEPTDLFVQDLEPETVESQVQPQPEAARTILSRPEPKEEPADEQIEGQMSFADFDLDALLKETADNFSEELASADFQEASSASVQEELSSQEELPSSELPETETTEPVFEQEDLPSSELPKVETTEPVFEQEDLPSIDTPEPPASIHYNEKLEIPDPEPTPDEKLQRTVPLNKIGQNTVPISIEDILKEETPEERRIRILNDAKPTRMNDDQRKIFTYFARIPGMDHQILEAINNVYEHAGEHTSRHGNIAVMGAEGTGKSRLSYGLIVAMCKDLGLEAVKIARLRGSDMNRKDPVKIVSRMSGGFLIIEDAGDMTAETIDKLNRSMEFRTDCMILIIEDEKANMRALLKEYPQFAQKFDKVISIPVFTNDELVTFARTYATENGCKMDELGVLALYTLISNNQSEEEPVTISKVKDMVDNAISHAKRGSRKFGRRSSGRDKSKEKWTILYEKDFDV